MKHALDKPLEYWLVIIGVMIWMTTREAETAPWWRRIAKIIASACLAVALSPALASVLWGSEIVAAVLVMSVGLIVLDTLSAVVSDRELLREIIARKLGGPRDE